MSSLQKTKEAIGFYELAIKNAQKLIRLEIEKDEDFQSFYKKLKAISKDYNFIFYDHNLKFSMYKIIHTKSSVKSINYFWIESNGEIVFNKKKQF